MNSCLTDFDALLVVSFGGPETADQVIPFLQNVLQGRRIPQERIHEVAEHYYACGGASPINAQNRELIAALRAELHGRGIDLPVWLGNRNWHPFLEESLREMRSAGVARALAFFTSAFSCYSGCRQYHENIRDARQRIGPDAPRIEKLPGFHSHPLFVEAAADRLRESISDDRISHFRVVFTAHSIPVAMAAASDYCSQLQETCRLVATRAGAAQWDLAYQSRSGPPDQPWLEPDIGEWLKNAAKAGISRVLVMPIGFLSDHMEVRFDLDVEARQVCEALGISMVRAGTVGCHPRFVEMIASLAAARICDSASKPGAAVQPDTCGIRCCLAG